MTLPDFLRREDPDWSAFSLQEKRDVLALRNRAWSSEDRDFAGVELIGEDEAIHVVKLTMDLAIPHMKRYAVTHSSPNLLFTNQAVPR
jgi:hypothetical protein